MKLNKKMIWGTAASLIFAIFVIIALYGTGFDASDGERFTMQQLSDIPSALRTGDAGSIYGLGVSSIVLAFVGILFPLAAMFFDNKDVAKFAGIGAILFDVTVLALLLGAFGLYTSDATTDGAKLANAGYIAGSFIFTIVGFGIGLAGSCISFKDSFKAN